MSSPGGTKAKEKRANLREALFPGEPAWGKEREVGFFAAPRTLPLLLQLLSSRAISGNQNPGLAYIELLSRHMGEGIVELSHEEDHAHAAGYTSVRAWRERLKILEDAGFIKLKKNGTRYAWVLLVHPLVAVEALRSRRLVKDSWYDSYVARRVQTKESDPV